MLWRATNFEFGDPDFNTFDTIPWLVENGCLGDAHKVNMDHEDYDYFNSLRLNVHAIGWHYLAPMIGAGFINDLKISVTFSLLTKTSDLVKRISRVRINHQYTSCCSLAEKVVPHSNCLCDRT